MPKKDKKEKREGEGRKGSGGGGNIWNSNDQKKIADWTYCSIHNKLDNVLFCFVFNILVTVTFGEHTDSSVAWSLLPSLVWKRSYMFQNLKHQAVKQDLNPYPQKYRLSVFVSMQCLWGQAGWSRSLYVQCLFRCSQTSSLLFPLLTSHFPHSCQILI